MHRSNARILLLPLLFAQPGVAQEFDLELTFDDEAMFEAAATDGDTAGPDISATLSYGATRLSGTTSDTASLRLDFSDRYDLGRFGFLDWEGHATLSNPGGTVETRAELDKIILQNSAGNLGWKIGKFPIGWGEIEGVPVLDVLNAGRSAATIGDATEDLPGQWFAVADYFAGETTISGFAGLDPEVVHLELQTVGERQVEFGIRASLPLQQGQMSLYAARLVPQTGVVDLVSGTSGAPPYTLLGASVHRAFDAVLLEFDLAVKSGLERASAAGLSRHDRLDAAIGLEYAATNTTQITASLAVQHWLDQDDSYFDTGLAGPVAAKQTSASYLLGVSGSMMGNDLDWSLYAGGALDGSARFAAVTAEYSLSDALKLNASFSQLWAGPGSLLEPVDGTKSLTLAAEYYF